MPGVRAPEAPAADARVRRLLRNASLLFSGNALASLLAFVQAVVLGRLLGAGGYGLLAVIIAFASTVNQVVDIRLWESVTKFVGEYHARGEHGRARATVKLAYLVDLGSGIAAFALVAALAPFAAARFLHRPEAGGDLVLFAGTLLVATVNDTSTALLRIFDRFRWLSGERVAAAAVRLGVLWAVAAATPRLTPLLAAYVAVELAHGLLLLALALAATRAALAGPGPDHLGLVRERFGEFWRFTATNAITTILVLVTRQLDILILSAVSTAQEVGLFRMAKNFGQLVLRVSDPVYHAIYPELVRLAVHDPHAARAFIARSMRMVLVVVVPAGLVIMLGAGLVLDRVVGREFAAAALPLRLVVAGALIHAVFLWARPLALAAGRPELSTWAYLAGAGVLAASSYLLVPRLGAVGSAITYVLTSAVTVGILASGAIRAHPAPGAPARPLPGLEDDRPA
jgi:O-antigen/teichoic acid export membrane protein